MSTESRGNDPAPGGAAARKLAIQWSALGIGSFFVALAAAWTFLPRPAPVAAPLDRLLLAVQLAAACGFVMLLMLQGLWRASDTPGAEDPFAGKESRRWQVNQRVMGNTVEQMLIFLPIYLGLAVRMQPAQVHWLGLLMGLWCMGRLMFWAGYHQALHRRAPGMDWTILTTMCAAVLFVMTLFG